MCSTMGFKELPTRGGAAARAAARERREFCIVHNGKAAMLAWMFTDSRARGHFCSFHDMNVATLAWKLE